MTQLSRFVFGTFALILALMGLVLLASPTTSFFPGAQQATLINDSYAGVACFIAALGLWSRILVATRMRL